jgi:Ca-activated chloride channel family protein
MRTRTGTAILTLAMLLAACGGESSSDTTGVFRPDPVQRDSSRVDEWDARSDTTGAVSDGAEYRDEPYPDVAFDDPEVEPPEYADENRLSTFALDVDTGSYTVGRTDLYDGHLPDPDSIRVEEWINFFAQDYSVPSTGEGFSMTVDGGVTPFTDEDTRVIRIGLRAEDVEERPPASLTFVVDTSGSMKEGERLEIVKESLAMLVRGLERDDLVTIVEFGSEAGLVLPPTWGDETDRILEAIDGLDPEGSTNFEHGLLMGYGAAERTFIEDGINRVVVASDGVANVGLVDPAGLTEEIRSSADSGINLVTVGVGMGNYNDALLEQLADDGDGFYAYIDTRDEAEDLFVRDLTGTLVTVAEDARVQVEFDPDGVSSWRLLGYENRAMADEDFRNDAVDAGELGAGHTVTALYEVRLTRAAEAGDVDRLGRVHLRWLDPATDDPQEMSRTLTTDDLVSAFRDTAPRFQLDVIVAQFAETLRRSPYNEVWRVEDLVSHARDVEERLADDEDVTELVELIERADRLGA